VRPPWESEDAAFGFLIRVLAVCVIVVLITLALKAVL